MATGSQPQVPQRSFEALFVHALARPPRLERRLRDLGVELDHLQPQYPISSWRSAIELARKELFPERSEEEALAELGRLVVRGFSETLVGRVFAAAARVLGPERVMVRVPMYLRAGRGEALSAEVTLLPDASWQLEVRDPLPLPDFARGSVEEVLALAGVRAKVVVAMRERDRFRLRVSWPAR